MQRKKLSISILFFSLLIFGFFGGLILSAPEKTFEQSETYQNNIYANIDLVPASFTEHTPIIINDNSEFNSTNGVVSGSGTANDPYCISNWQINASGQEYGVKIMNTDAHVIIQNCIIEFSDSRGIYLGHVYNMTIQNCTIQNIVSNDGIEAGLPGYSGSASESAYGIGLGSCDDIVITKNIISNIASGDGGRGADGSLGNGGNGGASGYVSGIYASSCIDLVISENCIFNLTSGNGGDGGDADMCSSSSSSGYDGGDGGNVYPVSGIKLDTNYFCIIHNNTIHHLYTGDGGNGANGTDSGSIAGFGGDGGEGGRSFSCNALSCIESDNLSVINNDIYEIYNGDSGKGGHGGDAVGIGCRSGNGGHGGDTGSHLTFYVHNCNSATMSRNLIHDVYAGNGGDAGNFGSNSSGATEGNGGQGGNSYDCTGFALKYSDNLTFFENKVYNVYGGLGGKGFDTDIQDPDGQNGLSVTIESTICSNSAFYANDFVGRCVSISNSVVNKWDNGTVGNYWGTYVDDYYDWEERDGYLDEDVYLGGISHENDTRALVFPFYGDYDADGLSNGQEYVIGSNSRKIDTDGDGMPDSWEVDNGYNPLSYVDGLLDDDLDGLKNSEEYSHGTNPNATDSDGDGFTDYEELIQKTDPMDSNSKPSVETLPQETSFEKFIDQYGIIILAGLMVLSVVANTKGSTRKSGLPNMTPE